MPGLAEQLALLPNDVKARLERYGFDAARLLKLGERLARGEVDSGVVEGVIEPPAPGDVTEVPAAGSAGLRAFAR